MKFIDSLHSQALEAAKRFKQAEADLVELFQKIEEARVFSKLGYTSLFDYGVKALGLSETFLEKNDPVRKANRARPQLVPGPVNQSGRSKIPNITRHALNFRDKGQCTFVDIKGVRCGQERWVEIHHIKPVSEGSSNSISNLTTLCFHHHRFTHQVSKV